jgi:hypothetical protein
MNASKGKIHSSPFLLELLHHAGLYHHWINWISVLLSTASPRILLNTMSGDQICHGHSLRQGNPLSPFLFVLTMEALNALFRHANRMKWLSPLRSPAICHRVSLYADDLVVFISPSEQDFRQTIAILEIFAGASGLRTNIGKCQLTPIRCTLDQVQLVQQIFPYQLVNFPCKYLGVPLSIHKLSKADL